MVRNSTARCRFAPQFESVRTIERWGSGGGRGSRHPAPRRSLHPLGSFFGGKQHRTMSVRTTVRVGWHHRTVRKRRRAWEPSLRSSTEPPPPRLVLWCETAPHDVGSHHSSVGKRRRAWEPSPPLLHETSTPSARSMVRNSTARCRFAPQFESVRTTVRWGPGGGRGSRRYAPRRIGRLRCAEGVGAVATLLPNPEPPLRGGRGSRRYAPPESGASAARRAWDSNPRLGITQQRFSRPPH